MKIQRGLKSRPIQTMPLAEIDEVRFDHASYNAFYMTGTLELVTAGQVKMRLTAVPEPESFRLAIINAVCAWVPAKAKQYARFVPASAKS